MKGIPSMSPMVPPSCGGDDTGTIPLNTLATGGIVRTCELYNYTLDMCFYVKLGRGAGK